MADPDPQGGQDAGNNAEWLAYLTVRRNAAVTYRGRVADALDAAVRAEKALAVVAGNDTGGCDGDMGGESAADALGALHAASRHLRNAHRIATGHERNLRDEIEAATAAGEGKQ